jgi:hypothetical protein
MTPNIYIYIAKETEISDSLTEAVAILIVSVVITIIYRQTRKFTRPEWIQFLWENSSVGIATGYRLDSRGSIPGRNKNFLLFTSSRPALGPTQPPIQWAPEDLSPGVKRPGCKFDHSPPSSAEVSNGGAIPPVPLMFSWNSASLIKHRDNFTSFYLTTLLVSKSCTVGC